MANAEYPDLPFKPPRAYGSGRPWANTPRVIVIHYTAGAERNTSAEDGAAYDARRTDGTSCHYFVDSDSVVQCVYTWDRANSALYNGNRIGIQYELCGTQQTRAQWLDPASDATLTNAARQAARDAKKYGIPIAKLSAAQVAAGAKGFCGHADITLAFPSDGGDHMDPGPAFPWDVFMARVQQFSRTTSTALSAATEPVEEDTMPFAVNIALPVNVGDTADVTIPPSNLGYFAGFKAYFKLVVDEDTPALYRVALLDGIGGTVDRVSRKGSKDAPYNLVLGKGRRKWESGDIPDGTCLVKMERLPSGDTTADGKPRHLTLCVEYGKA